MSGIIYLVLAIVANSAANVLFKFGSAIDGFTLRKGSFLGLGLAIGLVNTVSFIKSLEIAGARRSLPDLLRREHRHYCRGIIRPASRTDLCTEGDRPCHPVRRSRCTLEGLKEAAPFHDRPSPSAMPFPLFYLPGTAACKVIVVTSALA